MLAGIDFCLINAFVGEIWKSLFLGNRPPRTAFLIVCVPLLSDDSLNLTVKVTDMWYCAMSLSNKCILVIIQKNLFEI